MKLASRIFPIETLNLIKIRPLSFLPKLKASQQNWLGPLLLIVSVGLVFREDLMLCNVFLLMAVVLKVVLERSSQFTTPFDKRIIWILLGLCVAEVILFMFSSYRPNSTKELLYIGHVVAVVLFARLFLGSRGALRGSIAGLVIIGVAFGTWTVVKTYSVYHAVSQLGENDMMLFRSQTAPMFDSPNVWSSVLLALLPFSMSLFLADKKIVRFGGALSTSIVIAALLLCFSRGAVIALALFIAMCTVFWLPGKGFKAARRVSPLVFITTLFIMAIVYPFSQEISTTFAGVETASQQRSLDARIKSYQVGKECLATYPLFGAGHANFALKNNVLGHPRIDEPPLPQVQGLFIQIMSEKGWFGVFVYSLAALFLVFILVQFVRDKNNSRLKATLATVFMAGAAAVVMRDATLPSLFGNDQVFHLFAIDVGLAIALLSFNSRQSARRFSTRVYLPYALLILALGYSGFYSMHWYAARKSRQIIYSLRKGELSKAEKLIKRSLAIEPGQSTHHMHNAGVIFARQNEEREIQYSLYPEKWGIEVSEETINELLRAKSLTPDDETYGARLAWLYLCKGDWDKSIEEASVAAEVDPRLSFYQVLRGLAYWNKGDSTNTIEALASALELNPTLWLSPMMIDLQESDSVVAWSAVRKAIGKFKPPLENPILMARLGALQYFARDYTSAEANLRDANATLPDMNRPYYYLGMIELEREDTASAIKHLEMSSALDPADQLVMYELELLRTHDKQRAILKAASLEDDKSRRYAPDFCVKQSTLYDARLCPNIIVPEEFIRYISLVIIDN